LDDRQVCSTGARWICVRAFLFSSEVRRDNYLGFVIGFAPRVTYGLVFLLHAGSTFSSFRQYLHPFEGSNILFFAAWPMLGACFTLYYLRDLDTLWSVRGKKG